MSHDVIKKAIRNILVSLESTSDRNLEKDMQCYEENPVGFQWKMCFVSRENQVSSERQESEDPAESLELM